MDKTRPVVDEALERWPRPNDPLDPGRQAGGHLHTYLYKDYLHDW